MKNVFLLLLIFVLHVYSKNDEIVAGLKSLSEQKQIKVVYIHGGNQNADINPNASNSPLSQNMLTGFDTETGDEVVIVSNSPGIMRPLICYSGQRVIYSIRNNNESGVYCVNWDGTQNRKIANGIAGCLWYDSLNRKEFIIYGKNSDILDHTLIMKMSIDDPLEEDTLLNLTGEPELFSPALMSISKDARRLSVGLSGKTVFTNKFYDLTTKKFLYGSDFGTSWGCIPYYMPTPPDSLFRLFFVSSSFSELIIRNSNRFDKSVELLYEDQNEGTTYSYGGQGKFSSYDDRYYVSVVAEDAYAALRLGTMVVYRFNSDYSEIEHIAPISPSKGSMPDIWLYKEGGPLPVEPSLALTSPEGGNLFQTMSLLPVKWVTKGSVDSVRIELSVNGVWHVLAEKIENNNAFDYKIPDSDIFISSQCFIKISSTESNDISDVLEIPFSIAPGQKGTISLLSPTGGEICSLATDMRIRWESSGIIDSVKIELLMEDTTVVVSDASPNTGEFVFTIPDDSMFVSNQCKLFIYSKKDTTIKDSSNSSFTITYKLNKSITLLNPVGGETFFLDSVMPIRWSSKGNMDSVRIELSVNGVWHILAEKIKNNNAFDYEIPDSNIFISSQCFIKISSTESSNISDVLEIPFSITPGQKGTISHLSPTGGETCSLATDMRIRWESSGIIDSVKIELLVEDTTVVISDASPNTGEFVFTIPDDSMYVSNQCKLFIYSKKDTTIKDSSNSSFTITYKLNKSITLLNPVGGETFFLDSVMPIRWSSKGFIDSVFISLVSADTEHIFIKMPNDSECTFKIPDSKLLVSDSCKIRVRSIHDPHVESLSNNFFKIISIDTKSITINPLSRLKYNLHDTLHVTWTSTGNIDSIKIELLTRKGILTIIEKTSNDSQYSFIIPADGNFVHDSCRIIISEPGVLGHVLISDTTNTYFSIVKPIKNTIALITPHENDTILLGDSLIIEWLTTGNIETVSFSILYNDTSTLQLPRMKNLNRYALKLPKVVLSKSECKLFIKGYGETTVYDSSGTFYLLQPVSSIINNQYVINKDPVGVLVYTLSGTVVLKKELTSINNSELMRMTRILPNGTYVLLTRFKSVTNKRKLIVLNR